MSDYTELLVVITCAVVLSQHVGWVGMILIPIVAFAGSLLARALP